MSKTLCPKKGDHLAIEGIMKNFLTHLAYNKPCDLEDFFIYNLAQSTVDPFVPKPYAPWIQLTLDNDLERPYVTDCTHEYLIPLVRGSPRAPSTDKGKGIVGTSKQVPLLEAPVEQLPFHRRSSISVGPEHYTNGTGHSRKN